MPGRSLPALPLAAAALLGAAIASAVPAAPPESPDADQSKQPTLQDLPPQVRLGARIALVDHKLGVDSAVVIVPDAPSYAVVVAHWNLKARFPVLIDDGSRRSREDIARFVRAFRPTTVLRFAAPDKVRNMWPDDASARETAVEQVAAGVWGVEPQPDPAATAEELRKQWTKLGFKPPGVVVASIKDPAWTAALALAAGRGEPIVWVRGVDQHPSGRMTLDAADKLSGAITDACEQTGFAWRALGDDIDAVTLCLNCPGVITLPDDDKRQALATTDLIGRLPSSDPHRPERWAWAGQIFGSQAEAACSAMCALFLQPKRAWLFDGYSDERPWNLFDATAAAADLNKINIDTVVNDGPDRSAAEWRRRAAGRDANSKDDQPSFAVDADLITVNTHGMASEFNLSPGRCLAGDVPELDHPAIVYFVHSWSATRQADRTTIAGRFIEHGAYAYVGAVHEPYLQAFQPTPLFAARLCGSLPLGAAARLDNSEVWKIAVIGDPLITLHPDAPRTDHTPALEGAEDVQQQMADALKSKDFAAALTDLALLGRDRDAARLINALADEHPDDLTPDVAEAGVMSAFRAADAAAVIRLCTILADAGRLDAPLQDAVWMTLWPTLHTLRPAELDLLKRCVRPDQTVRDATEVADAIEATGTRDEAMAFLSKIRAGVKNDHVLKALDEAIAKR